MILPADRQIDDNEHNRTVSNEYGISHIPRALPDSSVDLGNHSRFRAVHFDISFVASSVMSHDGERYWLTTPLFFLLSRMGTHSSNVVVNNSSLSDKPGTVWRSLIVVGAPCMSEG